MRLAVGGRTHHLRRRACHLPPSQNAVEESCRRSVMFVSQTPDALPQSLFAPFFSYFTADHFHLVTSPAIASVFARFTSVFK